MKPKYRKRLSVGLLSAVFMLVLSVSAYAAAQLFSPKEVAEHIGDKMLAKAFESQDAIQVNQSKASGDYNFMLHGLVSGSGLSEFKHSAEKIYPDRTYAVVSVTRQDGKPMPDTASPEYGKESFFISPLVKGLKPWEVNIASMNGAYSDAVIDGIMYRLIECDQVEIFADRGVYLAISSGTSFYSNEAFNYDEKTGVIQAKEEYAGSSLLFDLPLDKAKADPEKVKAYVKSLTAPAPAPQANDEENAWIRELEELRARIRNGEEIGKAIPETIKEVSYDQKGNIIYTDGDRTITESPDDLFEKGQTGYSDKFSMSGDADGRQEALLFHRDENGVITGRIVVVDSKSAQP